MSTINDLKGKASWRSGSKDEYLPFEHLQKGYSYTPAGHDTVTAGSYLAGLHYFAEGADAANGTQKSKRGLSALSAYIKEKSKGSSLGEK